MTGKACNPVVSLCFKRMMSAPPGLPSTGECDTIVPLVFLHPRIFRLFSVSFRNFSFAGAPLRYDRSESTISGQFSFVPIY